jgi:hypothetical protein
MPPAQRGRRVDPELALGVIAKKAGVPLDWVQEVIDERFRGGEGRASGKLARKVRRLEQRAKSERKDEE